MKLYKYLSDDVFRDYLTSHLNGEVYLSSWRDFNDPMEGYFTYIAHRDTRHIIDAVVGEKSEYRVSCFCKSYRQFLLWSYYTNKHRGVCLEYVVQPDQLHPGCILKAVRYNDSLPRLDLSASVDEQARMFLLTKLKPWEQEQEVRLLARNVAQRTIPFGRLTGIIFGVNYAAGDPKDTGRQRVATEYRVRGRTRPRLYQAAIEGDSAAITRRPFDRYDQNPINNR